MAVANDGGPTLGRRPVVGAVWEVTLRCNLRCVHCGSRAGSARPRELTTAEALDLVEDLADVGVTEVVLIGGEAYLRQDWETISRAIVDAGMECGMTTGGWGLTDRLAERIVAAGMTRASVSVDGLRTTHDELRGRVGSFDWCFRALDNLQRAGIRPSANTQLNRRSLAELPQLYETLRDAGIVGWQVQFTGPMGRAADVPDLLIQPAELPVAHDVLGGVAARAWADGVIVGPGFNVGYFGPHERLIRGNGAPYAFWQGPDQGVRTLGIESDGTIKPELTLPTSPFGVGSVLDTPLRELLEAPMMRFAADMTTDRLRGFCAGCDFAEVCLGGDPWMAYLLTGVIGDNPFCDHRSRTLATRGRRERVVLVAPAPGEPYDVGSHETIEEDSTLPWPASHSPLLCAHDIIWPADWEDAAAEVRSTHTIGRDVDIVESGDRVLPRADRRMTVRAVGRIVEVKRRLDRIEQSAVHE